jgi:HlyD family secretion protein
MKRSSKIILAVILVIVVLVGIALVRGGSGRLPEVTVEGIGRQTIIETVTASGKIQPEVDVKISAEVSGLIFELPVKEGDQVEQGQLLVGINPDLYESALNRAEAAVNSSRSALAGAKARKVQAEAQLLAAERAWERSQQLFQQGAISQADYDQALSTFEVSKAEVEAANQNIVSAEFSIRSAEASRREAADNLKRTRLIAPQSGTVTALTKEVGEAVLGTSMMQGETIMRISDLTRMEVNVEVNESDIIRVSLGDTAIVEVDAFRNDKFKGVVTEIGNTALNALDNLSASLNQVTNFGVKIRILPESYDHLVNEKGESPFRPGMSATVEVRTDRADDALAIPLKAITTRNDTSSATRPTDKALASNETFLCVFVYEDGKAKLRVIETGIQDNRFMEVKKGVTEGDLIITGPYEMVSRRLRNGKPVDRQKITGPKEDDEE